MIRWKLFYKIWFFIIYFPEQNFELRITGRSESGQTIDIREDTTVASDQTQIVRIRIGDLGQGTYTLTARGRSPIEFDQSQKLEYVHKGYSIFIQTDKAIYRPGNNRQFITIFSLFMAFIKWQLWINITNMIYVKYLCLKLTKIDFLNTIKGFKVVYLLIISSLHSNSRKSIFNHKCLMKFNWK